MGRAAVSDKIQLCGIVRTCRTLWTSPVENKLEKCMNIFCVRGMLQQVVLWEGQTVVGNGDNARCCLCETTRKVGVIRLVFTVRLRINNQFACRNRSKTYDLQAPPCTKTTSGA